MKKLLGSTAALALLCLAAGPAGAEDFGELARKARPLSSPEALGALFWSLTEDCEGIQNDFRRRQCEGIRRARASEIAGRTFLVESSAAIVAGDFHPKKKSVPISVESCIACGEEFALGGQRRWVVGEGRHRVQGGEVHAAQLHETANTFSNAKEASAWKAEVLPRLRAEYLIRLPERPSAFKARGGAGYKVEVVGFRVYDPCDGQVLAARPKSAKVEADRSTCGEEAEEEASEEEKTAEKEEQDKPKKPQIPARLTPSQINAAMRDVPAKARKCLETYGVPGTARLGITISNEGKVVGAELKGDFEGTPTGKCVQKLVEKVKFPRSQKKRTTVDYPIMLR